MRGAGRTLAILLGGVAAVIVLLLVAVGGADRPHEDRNDRPEGSTNTSGEQGDVAALEGEGEVEAVGPAEVDASTLPIEKTIRGTVLDGEDKPVAGARIQALRLDRRRAEIELLARARANEAGEFVVGPVEGRVLLEAAADGKARARRYAQAGSRVDLKLEVPGILRGTVTYEGEKGACSDAVVRVTGNRGIRMGEARTDVGGAYRLDDLPSGTYRLSVLPPETGSVRASGIQVNAGEETVKDLVVPRSFAISGAITDSATGETIEGAEVLLTSNQRVRVRSDASGRYRTVGLVGANTNIRVEAEGYLDNNQRVPADPEGGDVTHDVKMMRGGTVLGVVLGPGGEPVAGARVGQSSHQLFQASPEGVTTTAEDGTFRLEDVKPGNRTLYAHAPGSAPGRTSARVQVKSGEETPGIEIRLTAGGTIAGTVRDDQGKAVAGASMRVWANRVRGVARPVIPSTPVQTREDGSFEVQDLPMAVYSVKAEKEGFTAEQRTDIVLADAVTVGGIDLTLQSGSVIAGKVLDGQGKPVEGARIWAYMQPNTGPWQNHQARSGTDGGFRLTGLRDGTYFLRANKTGFGTASRNGVRTGEEGVELRVVERPSLTGTAVVSGSGKPVTAFQIAVYRSGTTRTWPMRTQQVTDAGGKFSIKGLPAGTYEVVASTKTGLLSHRETVDVRDGQEASPVRLVLDQGASIRGVVTAPDGRPAAKARVWATAENGPSTAISATADAEGRFLLRPLSPGSYFVRASHAEWVEAQDLVGVTRGIESTVNLALSSGGALSVVVTDPDGTPLAGAYVILRRSNGSVVSPDWRKERRAYDALVRSNPGLRWNEYWNTLTRTGGDGVMYRRFLPADAYDLEIRRSGFSTRKVEAIVREARETPVRVTLEPATGQAESGTGPSKGAPPTPLRPRR